MKIPQVYAESALPAPPILRVPRAPDPGLDALPSHLPIPNPDVSGAQAYAQSLEYGGRALAQLGGTALDAVAAANEKRTRAAEHVEGVELFERAKSAVEADVATLEQDPPPDYRARVEKLLVDAESGATKLASSVGVQYYLRENFARFRGDVSVRATKFADKELVDKTRAAFDLERQHKKDDLIAMPRELDAYDEKDIDRMYARRRQFGMSEADAGKDKQLLLKDVRMGRARNRAFVDPTQALADIRDGKLGLDANEERTLIQFAESRQRQLTAEAEHKDALLRRDTQEKADAAERDWRIRILKNYAKDGPGEDLSLAITEDATTLGNKFDNVVAAHAASRKSFLQPERRTVSDKTTLITAQSAIAEGSSQSLAKATQVDLDRWFGNDLLSESDYQSLTTQRASAVKALQVKAEKGQTDAERQREQETKDAAGVLDAFFTRGNRYQGDTKAQKADLVIAEAKAELHRRVAAEPKLRPSEIADQIIERRIAEVEQIAQGLLYKTPDEVNMAYLKGLISRETAERYWRLLKILGRDTNNPAENKPKGP